MKERTKQYLQECQAIEGASDDDLEPLRKKQFGSFTYKTKCVLTCVNEKYEFVSIIIIVNAPHAKQCQYIALHFSSAFFYTPNNSISSFTIRHKMAMWILAKSMSWLINFIWTLSKQEFGQNRLVNVPFRQLQIDATVQQSLSNVS